MQLSLCMDWQNFVICNFGSGFTFGHFLGILNTFNFVLFDHWHWLEFLRWKATVHAAFLAGVMAVLPSLHPQINTRGRVSGIIVRNDSLWWRCFGLLTLTVPFLWARLGFETSQGSAALLLVSLSEGRPSSFLLRREIGLGECAKLCFDMILSNFF